MRTTSALASALCSVIVAGCSDDGRVALGVTEPADPDEPAPEECEALQSSFSITDRFQQPVGIFLPGEPITFELHVTNTSDTARSVTSPDSCPPVRFEVLDPFGEVVWSSADGLFCAQVVTTFTFDAAQTETFRATWDQRRRGGTPAPVGQYTARAVDRTACGTTLSGSGTFFLR